MPTPVCDCLGRARRPLSVSARASQTKDILLWNRGARNRALTQYSELIDRAFEKCPVISQTSSGLPAPTLVWKPIKDQALHFQSRLLGVSFKLEESPASFVW